MNQVVVRFDDKFHCEEINCYQSRGKSTVSLIQEAFSEIDMGPFYEYFDMGDYSDNPYSFSSDEYHDKLIPCFNFDSWPEIGIYNYDKTCADMQQEIIFDQLFWVGNTHTNESRIKFKSLVDGDDRIKVDSIEWTNSNNEWKSVGKFTPLVEHGKYKYLIDIEGRGYSARTKYLLHSGRPLFYQQRKWNEYWFFDMKPFEHYIPVDNDLLDFYSKYEWAIANEDKCFQIGQNAREFALKNLKRRNAVERYKFIFRTGCSH
jgi:hypothetical protein